MSKYIQDGYRGEVDYYLKTGTALMARVSRMTQHVGSEPDVHSHAWAVGGEHALTQLGNVIARAAYSQEHEVA